MHLLPDVLELLTGAPPGTVLTLNVPDRPVAALRELRRATLAEFGAVQTRVDRVDNGQMHLADVEVDTPPATGTAALLAAGYPTLAALESVREASSPVLCSGWKRSGDARRSREERPSEGLPGNGRLGEPRRAGSPSHPGPVEQRDGPGHRPGMVCVGVVLLPAVLHPDRRRPP